MKILLRDHNGVLSDLRDHFELVNTVQEADAIVLWQDIISMELCIARTAKKLGKPVIVVQHGRRGMTDYAPPFNNELIADKICVWGPKDRDLLISSGISEEKIVVTGTTIFEWLKGRTPHKGTNVLFVPEHWDHDIDENGEVMEELKKICKKNKWNLKAKIMERHDEDRYGDYAIYSNRDKPSHLSICADAIAWADVLVSLSEITFEMLAQASDIPVIVYTDIKPRTLNRNRQYLEYKREYSNAVKKVDKLSDLEKTIKQQLANPDELQNERKDIPINEGGIYIEDPLKEMVKVIKNA